MQFTQNIYTCILYICLLNVLLHVQNTSTHNRHQCVHTYCNKRYSYYCLQPSVKYGLLSLPTTPVLNTLNEQTEISIHQLDFQLKVDPRIAWQICNLQFRIGVSLSTQAPHLSVSSYLFVCLFVCLYDTQRMSFCNSFITQWHCNVLGVYV